MIHFELARFAMQLSERERNIWNEIQNWEHQLLQKESTDIQVAFDKWLNRTLSWISRGERQNLFAKADEWLFHIHAFIQSSQSQLDARNRILSSARIFDNSIEHIEELRKLSIDQLIYIAEYHIARHRLYSFVQGGATGAGGVLLLTADIPLMIVLNLKAVQLIATTYAYDVNKPYEMMLSLKVFHAAILPSHLQQYAWRNLQHDVQSAEYAPFFYEGSDKVMDRGAVQTLLKQVLKTAVIHSLRRKVFQGIPMFGIVVGSTANYRLTRNVTDFAHRFYQMRYLLEKQ